MKHVALFGTLIAVCSIGTVVGPTSASARAGTSGPGAGAHGMRAGPAFFHRGPLFTRGFAARQALRPAHLARQPISVLPYWPFGGDFAPFYYYPPATTAAADGTADPVAPSQQPPNRIVVAQPGCRTQEQQVPAEAGGTRVVHITRCY
jgi:hypothetical protein